MMELEMQRMKPFYPFKSPAVALLFGVFLGPIGVLYSSVWGGVFLIVLGFIVVCSQFIVPMIIVWLLSCIWSVAAVNRYNKKLLRVILQK